MAQRNRHGAERAGAGYQCSEGALRVFGQQAPIAISDRLGQLRASTLGDSPDQRAELFGALFVPVDRSRELQRVQRRSVLVFFFLRFPSRPVVSSFDGPGLSIVEDQTERGCPRAPWGSAREQRAGADSVTRVQLDRREESLQVLAAVGVGLASVRFTPLSFDSSRLVMVGFTPAVLTSEGAIE